MTISTLDQIPVSYDPLVFSLFLKTWLIFEIRKTGYNARNVIGRTNQTVGRGIIKTRSYI